MRLSTKITVGLLAIVGIVLLLVIAAEDVNAETIFVAKDGNGDYENIQDAINASQDGDTIRVWEGTYYENVVVDKTVSLVGNGSGVTTINGGGNGDVVALSSDWINLSGFLITQIGYDAGVNMGIFVESDHNNVFNNNCSSNYAGINIQDSKNSLFENNICFSNKMGIRNLKAFNNCIFNNNSISYNEWGTNFHYPINTTFDNNICSYNYIGVYLKFPKNCSIQKNNCSNNTIGIFLGSANNCLLRNNIIAGNDWGINITSSSKSNIVQYNNIYSNTENGIYASAKLITINATNNWWGDASGPYHPTENPEGKGDNVTDYVNFKPWLNTVFDDKDSKEDENEDEGFIPGFEAGAIITVVGLIVFVQNWKKRKEN